MNQQALSVHYIGLRLLAALVVVSLLLLIEGGPLMGRLVPLFEVVFSVAKPGLAASIHIERRGDEGQIITASAYTTAAVALDADHVLPPSTALNQIVWMDVLHALIPAVILLTALIAWPVAGLREIAVRASIGVPAVILAFLLTTPLYLAGRVDLVIRELTELYGLQSSPHPSPLMIWMIFTEMGGSWLLSIVLATVCIYLGQSQAQPRDRMRSALT